MPEKSLYTKKLGSAVAKATRRNAGRYHVISRDSNRWAVVSEGSVRATKAFDTRRAAILFAKKAAMEKTGEVYIHGRRGDIEVSYSYAG
jgi:hypothetical protein